MLCGSGKLGGKKFSEGISDANVDQREVAEGNPKNIPNLMNTLRMQIISQVI
jgi:hypothetical protein